MAKPNYIEDFQRWKESFKYSYPVTVRFSETDAFGHLNNTVSFVYFEQARINFFKEIGLAEEWFSRKGKTIPVTADLQCDYLHQIYFDEELRIFVKVGKIGNTSVDLHYMIQNKKGEICITGRGRMVQISQETGKPLSWSEQSKKRLEKSM
ncbi:acyl-CoA thioester hydrolase [Evansella vedderi]|uniref:Acyl-CoA thioester hydrolase n=1 Tax=Evansella vedderi TaxID=38282 RepID=A0ABU0A018_9BACI|nr:thioesterase family protein [Evansella vedderi]MDQ0256464.1 acyl-CoA thioester hydrolase [Evansella vedderi]